MNSPGDPNWDPQKPDVIKWDDEHGCITGSNVTFVDDRRGSGKNLEHAWQVFHCFATRFQYQGIQVALHNIHPPSQKPGAWTGCTMTITKDSISKSIAESKWDKARNIIQDTIWELEDSGTTHAAF